MAEKALIQIEKVSDNLLSNLESRDVALWIRKFPQEPLNRDVLITFIGLPWRTVIFETYDPEVAQMLEAAPSIEDPLTRKRGYVQIIDSDPSNIELPQRCLPVYLLNGRSAETNPSDFQSRLRHMTMLEALRRSGPRDLLVLSGDNDPLPFDLKDIWSAGFRSYLTFVSTAPSADKLLEGWINEASGVVAANLLRVPSSQVILDILARYTETYPEHRRVLRIRDSYGKFHKIDVTSADEPERPILESYLLLEERDLTPLTPTELSEEDFVGFFRDPEKSWRPYAAGLPWVRNPEFRKRLNKCLTKLDASGAEENCIAYITSEPGAGGSTLARILAWECAREGYPVLLAKSLPFVPDALTVGNYLTRVHRLVLEKIAGEKAIAGSVTSEPDNLNAEPTPRLYEAPWVVVFDSLHWQDRESELIHFRNELEKAGRPVCILLVTGTVLVSFFTSAVFKLVAELNHAIDQNEARQLGHHLNQFLRNYGKERQESQWDRFYQEHTVRYLEGTAAFWVTLSFWIQGQYDLSESIQQWIYRSFSENNLDPIIQNAILEIAAVSSVRLPLPEGLLPESNGKWPMSYLLDDSRSRLAGLGLLRIASNGEKYWALIHDILGRFLINALFYDYEKREKLGFAAAKDAEHLRFLLLRKISKKPLLGDRAYRSIGEDFATTIFKIDPDHGHASFASLWREVLDALDNMPRPLRDTNRVFRHHTAISRRRIAKLDENFYGVSNEDRIKLLTKAIEDINYALTFIEYKPGSEPNLNLYNSLANAYFDLAKAESDRGTSPPERIAELRQLGSEATRKAYSESPTNSFVIETYVKDLLQKAHNSDQAVDFCIEALGILFSQVAPGEGTSRAAQLGYLADEALSILFKQKPVAILEAEPSGPTEVLLKAWTILSDQGDRKMGGLVFSEVPEERRFHALDVLADPAGRGNMQVLRLRLDLTCLSHPYDFKQQLEFVEQLQASDYRFTRQLQLEYAILLFQTGHPVEGDKIFRRLRQAWRESENFVQVPERLRWLRAIEGKSLQSVHAITGSDYGYRAMARVQEFGNILVPFRPEEHGFHEFKPGLRFICHVSFGHNGPFLRPVTATPMKKDGGSGD